MSGGVWFNFYLHILYRLVLCPRYLLISIWYRLQVEMEINEEDGIGFEKNYSDVQVGNFKSNSRKRRSLYGVGLL